MIYVNISELNDNLLICNGAIFRHFNVGRLDANEKEEDYYDMMLFEIGDVFCLINITANSNKRGIIEARIDGINTKHFIIAKVFKEYFKHNADVYVIKEGYNVGYIIEP